MKKLMIVATVFALSAGTAQAATFGTWFSNWNYTPVQQYVAPIQQYSLTQILVRMRSFMCLRGCAQTVQTEPTPTSEVPLPAAGLLLLGGLGGFAVVRRRRKAS